MYLFADRKCAGHQPALVPIFASNERCEYAYQEESVATQTTTTVESLTKRCCNLEASLSKALWPVESYQGTRCCDLESDRAHQPSIRYALGTKLGFISPVGIFIGQYVCSHMVYVIDPRFSYVSTTLLYWCTKTGIKAGVPKIPLMMCMLLSRKYCWCTNRTWYIVTWHRALSCSSVGLYYYCCSGSVVYVRVVSGSVDCCVWHVAAATASEIRRLSRVFYLLPCPVRMYICPSVGIYIYTWYTLSLPVYCHFLPLILVQYYGGPRVKRTKYC